MSLYFEEYKKKFPGELFYYGNASHAFYDILVWLQQNNPREKPNVLMPAFIPAKLYRIVLAAGYEPRFYDISLHCEMDMIEINNLIDDQTQAIFCIHYFGIPASVRELKGLAKHKDIFLIEDCAHTLCARNDGIELGTVGDCALFSTRKMLQMPAGGFLALNREPWEFKPSYKKRVRSIYTACKAARSRLKYIYFKLTQGYDPLNLAWIPSTGYIRFSENHHFNIKEISWLNKAYTHSIDLEKVVQKRRENYERLLNGVADLPYIEPVGKAPTGPVARKVGERYWLEEGVTPYSFPILVPLGTREIFRDGLCRIGVGCGAGWPESPFGHSGLDRTAELSRRLIELPIHQGIHKSQLDRMIRCLRSYERESEGVGKFGINTNKRRKTEVV